jgi:hypothetical protein
MIRTTEEVELAGQPVEPQIDDFLVGMAWSKLDRFRRTTLLQSRCVLNQSSLSTGYWPRIVAECTIDVALSTYLAVW